MCGIAILLQLTEKTSKAWDPVSEMFAFLSVIVLQKIQPWHCHSAEAANPISWIQSYLFLDRNVPYPLSQILLDTHSWCYLETSDVSQITHSLSQVIGFMEEQVKTLEDQNQLGVHKIPSNTIKYKQA